MYYSTNDFSTAFDLLSYCVSKMKNCNRSEADINSYITDAVSSNNLHLVEVSNDMLDECKNYNKSNYYHDDADFDEFDLYGFKCLDDSFTDEYYDGFDLAEDKDLYYNSSDEEAYEGFDSCRNYLYSSRQ